MYLLVKRLMDIAISATVLLLIWPFLLMIAVAIRLESPGSPFFFQQRVGKGLKNFYIVKFRSMVKDAPALGSFQTQDEDPRITRMGKFVRSTSIDELPQLWNVLVGDMSLIGPRPNTPAQEEQYSKEAWKARHAVKPGITGLAQISGRSSILIDEQAKYDMQYASQFSLGLDIHIIVQTIVQVLNKMGTN